MRLPWRRCHHDWKDVPGVYHYTPTGQLLKLLSCHKCGDTIIVVR
jgi:hypothetical protein